MPTLRDLAGGLLLLALGWPAGAPLAAPCLAPSVPGGSRQPNLEAFEPVSLPGALEQRFFIQEENDVFGLFHQSDRYYTQGLRVGARWESRPEARFFCEAGARELWGFEFGQNIYTPSDITVNTLAQLRGDRPYAGYLYVGPTYELRRWHDPIPTWARLRAGPGETDEAFTSSLKLDLRLGRTGPKALGGPVQTGFHQLLRAMAGNDSQALPAGWGLYETANVASVDLTAEYTADWIRLSTPVGLTASTGSRLFLRVAPGARVDVGGMVDAAGLGLETRFGLAQSDLPPAPDAVRTPVPFELYLWGRAQGRYVAYTRFIEGELLHGVRNEARPERWGGELSAGVVVRLFVFELVGANQWRRGELRPGPASARAVHNFGSVRLAFLFY